MFGRFGETEGEADGGLGLEGGLDWAVVAFSCSEDRELEARRVFVVLTFERPLPERGFGATMNPYAVVFDQVSTKTVPFNVPYVCFSVKDNRKSSATVKGA